MKRTAHFIFSLRVADLALGALMALSNALVIADYARCQWSRPSRVKVQVRSANAASPSHFSSEMRPHPFAGKERQR